MQSLAKTAIPTTTSTSSGTTASSATAAATSEAIESNSSDAHSSSGLSTGAIVGIAVGGTALLVLAGGLFYFFGRSKTLSEQLRHSRTPNTGNTPNANSGFGYAGANSRHTSVLPPYAQVVPHYANEAKPPSLTEADGGMVGGYGHVPPPAMSPEMRSAETFGGFSYPDSRPSIQNMQNMR
jgi:hypothetical protein